jgi:hypothetical protein
LPIELVGNERERNVIGAKKPTYHLEERAAEPGMT